MLPDARTCPIPARLRAACYLLGCGILQSILGFTPT
jgi:hypothetical protein